MAHFEAMQAKYRDLLPAEAQAAAAAFNKPTSKLLERLPLYCVPLPAEPWGELGAHETRRLFVPCETLPWLFGANSDHSLFRRGELAEMATQTRRLFGTPEDMQGGGIRQETIRYDTIR